MSEQFVFIDAANGKVVNVENLICTTNSPGTAETRYSGQRSLVSDSYSGGFRLMESRNSVSVHTRNLQKGGNLGTWVEFVDNDNSWTASEHANTNRDQAALDSHWGAEKVLDYWRVVHNRNSLNGSGLSVISNVHYGTNFNNAFWDKTAQVATYGDGNGTTRGPLTTLDICAHELGHGICQFTANLTYHGESGAINEGLSDIWGAAVDFWTDPTKPTWLFGDETGATIRSLSNPNSFSQPDTYMGIYWVNTSSTTDAGGVHTNSGVFNYWFYLLSQGGTGTNDLGNSYKVLAIGISDASKIAYRAEAHYLTASSNFQAARSATIQAAKDLFGVGSCGDLSVTNAWHAVGVGDRYNTFTGLSITGQNSFCTKSTPYTLVNPPYYHTVVWSLSPASMGTIDVNGVVTKSASFNGSFTVIADVSTCNQVFRVQKTNIGAGIPVVSIAYNPSGPCNGSYQPWQLNGTSTQPATSWLWTKDNSSSNIIIYSPNSPSTNASVAGGGGVSLTVNSACGTGRNGVTIYGNCQTLSSLSTSPNPTEGEVTVSLNADEGSSTESLLIGETITPNIKGSRKTASIKQVNVVSSSGIVVKSFKYNVDGVRKVKINLSNLSKGLYTLQVLTNEGVLNSKVALVK